MNGAGMSDDMEEIDYKICGELGKSKGQQRLSTDRRNSLFF